MTTGAPGSPGPGPTAQPLGDAPEQLVPIDTAPEDPPGLTNDRRERTRNAALNTNARLDFAGDLEEAALRFRRWRTVDPFPDVDPALLNAADLLDYIRATGMIFPEGSAEDLKPASLQMHVEGPYQYVSADGNIMRGELRRRDDPDFDATKDHHTSVQLPGDTIVFVTVRPDIQMPDYMVMRFNLKIDHVYKGLLLGTGPLVDPGFTGRLSIPLHNLTSKEYILHAGDGLIWAEFTKLSRNRLFSAATTRDASRQAAAFPPPGPTRRRGIPDYLQEATGGETPSTSVPKQLAEIRGDFATFQTVVEDRVATTEQASDKAGSGVRRLERFFAGISVIALIATVLAVAAILVPTIGLVHDSNSENRGFEAQLTEQQQEISDLQAQLAQVRAALAAAQAKKPVRP